MGRDQKTEASIIKIGFKYIRENDDQDGNLFQASFPLPDDGVPGSEQFLKISVSTHDHSPTDVVLEVVASNGMRCWRLGYFETTDMDTLSRLLYGGARLVTTKTLVPV